MKRICSLFLTLVLILGLAACGQSKWQEQYDLGVKYLSEGNYEEAIIAFTAAIEIDPKQAPLYSGRGRAYVFSGETAENLAAALADFEAALELDETLAEAWLGLADVYIRQGDYDKALEVLRTGLDKTGNDERIAGKIAEIESGIYTDSSGRKRRESSYDGAGNLIWYRIYGYPEGKSYEVTSYDAAGNQTGYAYSASDGNGNQTAMVGSSQIDGTVSQILLEYDGSNNHVKSTYYTSAGEISQYTVFTHDAAGNCTRMETFGPDGALRNYDVLEYNAAGKCVKRMYFGADGSLTHYQEDEWDEQGRITESRYYDSDGTLHDYSVTEYNEYGRSASYYYNGDGTLNSKIVYVYNEQGKKIGEERYDGAGNLTQSTVSE